MELLIVTVESRGAPGALCRVTHETPARFYVEVVDWGWWLHHHQCVSGSITGSRHYVDKGAVLAVGVTRAQYNAYKARWDAWQEAEQAVLASRKELLAQYQTDVKVALGITQPWYLGDGER